MKSTKDAVYEFIRQSVYVNSTYAQGVQTKDIATALGKQRSNISSILNELVAEGKLVKSVTRPVIYTLSEQAQAKSKGSKTGVFIGENGSLRNAVQLVKAAVLYPKNPLNVLFCAKSGCGTTYFAEMMYHYAVEKGVLEKNAPYIKINCRHYSKNVAVLDDELFGSNPIEGNCFQRAKGGILFIDSFDLMDVRQQNRIFSFLDTGYIIGEMGERIDCKDVYLIFSCSIQHKDLLKSKIPLVVELPDLADRPLEERFLLVNRFLEEESQNLRRNIEVSSEAISALLLTEFEHNVRELQSEVLTACVNAYVRVANEENKRLSVVISDFSQKVSRSLLHAKSYDRELNALLGNTDYLLYEQENGLRSFPVKNVNDTDIKNLPNTDVKEEKVTDEMPVLLYAMHGNGTAYSLCQVTNELSHCNNAYSYDLSLNIDAPTAMEELKNLIERINRGAGVIVIYDMGSIKTMIDIISEEIDIEIRCLNIPITMIGIEAAHKCAMEKDVDSAHHLLCQELRGFGFENNHRNSVIITLCHTGEGGAVYLKNYIDQYSNLGIKTIAMEFTDRKALLKEIMSLKKAYSIHAFVGTYNPKLLGIPFLSISALLEVSPENLDRVLMFEPLSLPYMNYAKVYDHLAEQFKYASISKIKSVLPPVVDELAETYALDSDQTLGLFTHLACVIERILSGKYIEKNSGAKELVNALDEDYRTVSKIVKQLEKAFKIIIDDNEIGTLIMILKRI